MVRIKIRLSKAVVSAKSLWASGTGLAALALVFFAALGSLGEDRDDSAETVTAKAPVVLEPLGVPPVTATAAASGPAATSPAGGTATGERPGSHPNHLLQLPSSVGSVLVFDLAANRMHVFERSGGRAAPVGDFFVAVGKKGINKQYEGDEKTPIGIYFISSYIPGSTLPAIYGVGAYPLNYPNTWDRRRGRTGSGIWIHGTDKDDESLLPKSSRGCLTLRNDDFELMARVARIHHTPVIVSPEVEWVETEQVAADRDSLASAIESWRSDWESLDTDRYLRHYAADFSTRSMSRAAWTAHKRRVNARKSFIRIGIEDVGIYGYPGEPGLFLVTFEQHYESSDFNGRKRKHQYWRRQAGEWRIVHEGGI